MYHSVKILPHKPFSTGSQEMVMTPGKVFLIFRATIVRLMSISSKYLVIEQLLTICKQDNLLICSGAIKSGIGLTCLFTAVQFSLLSQDYYYYHFFLMAYNTCRPSWGACWLAPADGAQLHGIILFGSCCPSEFIFHSPGEFILSLGL